MTVHVVCPTMEMLSLLNQKVVVNTQPLILMTLHAVLENGDGDLSESEDDGVYLILNAEDCSFCVPKNEDEDLSESEDEVFCLFPDAVDGACDWVQFGDGVSIKMWQSSFLCNVKYKIHMLP